MDTGHLYMPLMSRCVCGGHLLTREPALGRRPPWPLKEKQ